MTTTRARGRKNAKPKVENYYKTLGLRANARQETIKPKYIEMLKMYPPETHPEQFEQIRRAYETLRDPVKRSEYDLLRKYGGQAEKVLEEAGECLEAGELDKAIMLYEKAAQMAPHHVMVHFGWGQAAFLNNDRETFEEQFRLAMECAKNDEEKTAIGGTRINLLIEYGEAEQALAGLDALSAQLPEQYADRLLVLYSKAYTELGRGDEALAITEKLIPPEEEQQAEDIVLYIHWINVVSRLERWNIWSKVQSRSKRFLRSIRDEDDKQMVLATIMQEYLNHFEAANFREAQLLIDLASQLEPRHPMVREGRELTQKFAALQRQIDQMEQDPDLFPLIAVQAIEWFYESLGDLEEAAMVKEGIPRSLLGQLEMMNEEYASGIMQLRKKYPLVYREFADGWDELFEEKTRGLNREARRRLR